MKIAHILHSFYPHKGGIENVVRNLAEKQADLGHQVLIITSDVGLEGEERRCKLDRLKILRLKSKKFFYNDLILPLETPDVKAMDLDVIHTHSHNSLFSVRITEKFEKLSNAKIAFHLMAVNSFSDHPNPIIRLFGSLYSNRNVKKAVKISDLRLVKSYRDKKILSEDYDVGAFYLPDGIPKYYLERDKASSSEFKKSFGINQEDLFLYIGRINRLKGLITLIKALIFLHKEDVGVVFVGPESKYRKKLEKLAQRGGVKEKIYFLGFLDEEEKINAIDSSEAVVVPSICDSVETFSLVISEAWARETPVITSTVGELPYRVEDGVDGLLFDTKNPKSLSKAMKSILNRNTEEMGKRGKEKVLTWKEIAKNSIKLYETC